MQQHNTNGSVPPHGLAFPLLLVGSCAAGSAALFAKISPLDPVVTTFWRFAIAAPILLLFMAFPIGQPPRQQDALQNLAHARTRYPTNLADMALICATGSFFAAAQMLWFLGLEETSVANATLLLSLTPLIAAIILWLWFKEHIGSQFWIGMALAIIGMAGLTYASSTTAGTTLHGDLLCLGSALSLSGYFIGLSRLRRRYQAMPVIALSAVACTGVMLLTVLLRDAPILPTSLFGWQVVIGLAFTSQIIGHGLMTYAVAHLPGKLAAASVLVQPIWATWLAWLLLDETVPMIALISGTVILIGIYLTGSGTRRVHHIIKN
jgi:drug/metabolite transporter (DMT)-like permease